MGSPTPPARARARLASALGVALVACALVAFGGSTLHCFFGARDTVCAPAAPPRRGRRLGAQLTWPSRCGKAEWTGLMPCMFGLHHAGCPEARGRWYDAGCLCDYDQYRSHRATPAGYVWTMMALGRTYPELAAASGCLEDGASCRAPREGDVRLDAYGRGVAGRLRVYADGAWAGARGTLSNATALRVCERLGFTSGVSRQQPTAARAPPEGAQLALGPGDAAGGDVLALRTPGPPAEHAPPTLLECDGAGVAGCFFERSGERACEQDGITHRAAGGALPPAFPTMACGTAGSYFLAPEADPAAAGGGAEPRGSCVLVRRAWARTCGGALWLAALAWLGAAALALPCALLLWARARGADEGGAPLRGGGAPASDERPPPPGAADAEARRRSAGPASCCVCQ